MQEKNRLKRIDSVVGVSIALIALIFYFITVSHTVDYIDCGELATVAHTLGIAHPTGYPIFTLIVHIFSQLPLPIRTIHLINLFSSFACAAGLFFFFKFQMLFFHLLWNKKGAENSQVRFSSFLDILRRYLGPLAGTFALAFSETYWSTALSIEVYSLHIFFICLLLFLFAKAIQSVWYNLEITAQESNPEIIWLIFFYVLGLSFTNHMTAILVLPGFIYFYFYVYGFNKGGIKRILRLLIPFFAGLSVYLYLPIRSAQNPILNWGNPVDFEKFFWHLSGKVYRVWIFSSTESAVKQFSYFFNSLPAEFGYIFIVIAMLGVWYLFKVKKVLFVFTIILFLTCVGYSINYDIHDIDSYFLLAYIMIATWISIGTERMVLWSKKKIQLFILGILIIIFISGLIVINYQRVDKRNHDLVETYTRDMLNSLKPNAIIISYQWDYFVSASYYFQIVEGIRPDVVVIDKELLRRSWYFKQLEKRYPWLINKSRKELELFLGELDKFEHDKPYNPASIEYRYTSLINSIINENINERPVYVTPEIEENYTRGFRRVPSGLAFRLFNDEKLPELDPISFIFTPRKGKDKYDEGIIGLYARAYLNYAIYCEILGKYENIIGYIDKSLEIKPDLREAIYYRKKIIENKSVGK